MSRVAKKRQAAAGPAGAPHPFDFFGALVWLDGRPLMSTIEEYRRRILENVLFTFGIDGRPIYNMALCGRAKKNSKTSDLAFAGLYRFLAWPSSEKGNDAFILAADEGQAGDDLSLIKKLIAANPILARDVTVLQKEVVRRDGKGTLKILPARDAVGAHGKTYVFCGFDEIHSYKSHDLFEALAPDPTRHDALIWITSYAGVRHTAGVPLFDFMEAGKRGDDPRLYFSWYSGDYTTDPALVDADPEIRANPSLASWGNDGYLGQQRKRLPSHKYRRLHLNLPGAPDGAAYDGDAIVAAIVPGLKRIPPLINPGTGRLVWNGDRAGFTDLSGGSSDFATLAIARLDWASRIAILEELVCQTGAPPFNPRLAVSKFATILKEYDLSTVIGDAYAGLTYRFDFQNLGINYLVSPRSKSELYDAFEPKLNAGEIELLDHAKLQEQLLTLVVKNGKIDHQSGDHDDFANAAVGALISVAEPITKKQLVFG